MPFSPTHMEVFLKKVNLNNNKRLCKCVLSFFKQGHFNIYFLDQSGPCGEQQLEVKRCFCKKIILSRTGLVPCIHISSLCHLVSVYLGTNLQVTLLVRNFEKPCFGHSNCSNEQSTITNCTWEAFHIYDLNISCSYIF